jgi:hypothetical protein
MLLRWLALWLLLAAPLHALEVKQVLFGFDGKLVPGRFNPVSVLLDNPRPGSFEGLVICSSSDAGARGAEYVQPVFLAPHTMRWVQFHIYVGSNAGHYMLQWGRGAKDRYEIPEDINLGPPGRVWLRDAANPFAVIGAVKSFPEELFPTTVVATSGLHSVVLDHTPRWEPARREAFLDWVRQGGTVHLIPGADGSFPTFADGLEALNAEAKEAPLGEGRIVRHQIGARELNEKYLTDNGYAPAVLKKAQNPTVYDMEGLFSQRLSSLTRPTVSWATIHFLALAYVAVIGPLHFRYRRRLDYRVSILAFLGTVVLFGTLFAVVGRRGYGESQTVNSLTIAHALGGGRHDTTQWVSAFATAGDLYKLTHEAPANLYGPVGFDAGASRILNGKDGNIQMDIPLYSSRTFLHRAVMKGDDTSVTAEKISSDGNSVQNVRLRTGPGFPKKIHEVRLLVRNTFYDVKVKDGVLEIGSASTTMGDFFSRDKLSPIAYHNQFMRNQNPDAHRELMPILMAYALGAPDVFQQDIVETKPSDYWRLCIVAPAPESFRMRGEGFEHERGWVLYIQDIPPP